MTMAYILAVNPQILGDQEGSGMDSAAVLMATAIPAYLCLIAMPLFYSISEGIAFGVISYVIINLACGKAKNIFSCKKDKILGLRL